MSGHDELCTHDNRYWPCICEQLRQAREQERERIAGRVLSEVADLYARWRIDAYAEERLRTALEEQR